MKITFLILIASVLLFTLHSCKDDEPQYLGEFRLGAERESYIKFEPGSYWVYENDISGERDSVVMEYYRSEMWHFEGLKREYYREYITFQWQSTLSTYTSFNIYPFPDLTPEELFKESVNKWSFYTSPSIGSDGTIIAVPINKSVGDGFTDGLQTNYVDSLQVSDEWFYDVAIFEVDNDPIFDSKPSKYYWAKNVGLIKKENFSHLTGERLELWNLVKYQVTQ